MSLAALKQEVEGRVDRSCAAVEASLRRELQRPAQPASHNDEPRAAVNDKLRAEIASEVERHVLQTVAETRAAVANTYAPLNVLPDRVLALEHELEAVKSQVTARGVRVERDFAEVRTSIAADFAPIREEVKQLTISMRSSKASDALKSRVDQLSQVVDQLSQVVDCFRNGRSLEPVVLQSELPRHVAVASSPQRAFAPAAQPSDLDDQLATLHAVAQEARTLAKTASKCVESVSAAQSEHTATSIAALADQKRNFEREIARLRAAMPNPAAAADDDIGDRLSNLEGRLDVVEADYVTRAGLEELRAEVEGAAAEGDAAGQRNRTTVEVSMETALDATHHDGPAAHAAAAGTTLRVPALSSRGSNSTTAPAGKTLHITDCPASDARVERAAFKTAYIEDMTLKPGKFKLTADDLTQYRSVLANVKSWIESDNDVPAGARSVRIDKGFESFGSNRLWRALSTFTPDTGDRFLEAQANSFEPIWRYHNALVIVKFAAEQSALLKGGAPTISWTDMLKFVDPLAVPEEFLDNQQVISTFITMSPKKDAAKKDTAKDVAPTGVGTRTRAAEQRKADEERKKAEAVELADLRAQMKKRALNDAESKRFEELIASASKNAGGGRK